MVTLNDYRHGLDTLYTLTEYTLYIFIVIMFSLQWKGEEI